MEEDIDRRSSKTRVFTAREKRFLTRRRFRHLDLDRVDFSGAILVGSLFQRVSLREADFSYADLGEATFVGCDLRGAVFDGCSRERLSMIACAVNQRTSFATGARPFALTRPRLRRPCYLCRHARSGTHIEAIGEPVCAGCAVALGEFLLRADKETRCIAWPRPCLTAGDFHGPQWPSAQHAFAATIGLQAGEGALALSQATLALLASEGEESAETAAAVRAALEVVFAARLYDRSALDELRSRLFPV